MVKWSSRNGAFEEKKRTGKPKVLNEAAKKVLKKAKCIRGNSTRQLSQQLASKDLVGGKKHRLEVYQKRSLEAAKTAKETSAYRQAMCNSPEICQAVLKPHYRRMGRLSFLGRMSKIFVSAA